MRKDIILPGLTLGAGGLGLGLRFWQLRSGYDPETQLFLTGHPAALLLPLLALALAVAAVLLLWGVRGKELGPAPIRCPSPLYMSLMAAAAILMLVGGLLGLLYAMEELNIWRWEPMLYSLPYLVALFLCPLLALAAGAGTMMVGKGAYRGNAAPVCSLLVVFPPMAALAWTFTTHLAHSTDPVLMGYGYSLAAAVFLTLSHYYAAAFFHDRPHPFRWACCAVMGTFFGLTSLLDSMPRFQMVLTAAFSLSALAQLWALLRSGFGPAWPPELLEARMPLGAEDEEAEDEH